MQLPADPAPPQPQNRPKDILVKYLRKNTNFSYKELYDYAIKGEKLHRKRRGRPYAAIIAFKNDKNEVEITWSHCCKGDIFSKRNAINEAFSRLQENRTNGPTHEVAKALPRFKEYAERYFAKHNS